MTFVNREPIAVVGVSCRFPGAADPEKFWDLLRHGQTGIVERPAGRAPAETASPVGQGSSSISALGGRGGFLSDVASFDADFFGISPREAAAADPQQRLALELGWEVLEDAGITAASLRGSRTGVFVGAISDDYSLLMAKLGSEHYTNHSFTGLERGLIANRLSYFLDLRGPSLVVDSAQSSSLLAIYQACQSLWLGACDLAIAGGAEPESPARARSSWRSSAASLRTTTATRSIPGRTATFEGREVAWSC